MNLDGNFTYVHSPGDLLVEITGDNIRYNLALTRSQRLVVFTDFNFRLVLFKALSVPSECGRYRIKHILATKWLCQKIHRSCFHCRHGHSDVTVASHKNNWDRNF